ncbi:MAG: UbiA family prenyltransferase [Candidatus Promineifilaceae bacterium]|nr:UbiA family prenyltransferase [Candidatus Promineifilaceae bacterium]
MARTTKKSVITCDLEGRIETFNDGAQEIFGYEPSEVIGAKRVSAFSPGLIVLGHVNDWLATAREEGEYIGQTVFVRKDGSRFAADIRITPTFRRENGQKIQIGYCGVTTPRPDVPVEQAMPELGLGPRIFRWLVVTRAPFLTATIVPVLMGAAWAVYRGEASPFPWLLFALTMIGAIALHVAANTFNDYFDWQSGTDQANNDYFLPYTGGSRSIELGLVTPPKLFRVAVGALLVAVIAGLALTALGRPLVLLFGAIGAFSAYFYTAPPLRLVARKGLGELLIGLNFGLLMVAGTSYTLTGSLAGSALLLGLPIGLLVTAILWINQFPDAASDEATGKLNLVVVLGKERARWGYAALMVATFAVIVLSVVSGLLPAGILLGLLALPLAVYTTTILFRHYRQRTLVKANSATILLHVVAGSLLAVGLFFNDAITSLF